MFIYLSLKRIFLFVVLFYCCSFSGSSQDLNDFKTPKSYSFFRTTEANKKVNSSIHFNEESLGIYKNDKLFHSFTDLIFLRNEVLKGMTGKLFLANNANDKTQWLLFFSKEKHSFSAINSDNELSFVISNIKKEYSCFHDDLSKEFNLKVSFRHKIDESCYVSVEVRSKDDKTLFYPIEYKVDQYNFYPHIDFHDCDNVSSLSTGKKIDDFLLDSWGGDVVVADFNFDGKDDIALLTLNTNGGCLYDFYVQDNYKSFSKDQFLTDKLRAIPSKIDKNNKRLIKLFRVGARGGGKIVLKYNEIKKSWKVESVTQPE